MRIILVMILTAFCMLGSVSMTTAGSYQGNDQYSDAPSADVTRIFAAFPDGGDSLVAALLQLLLKDSTLADDVAFVASKSNTAQQDAAAAAMAQAYMTLFSFAQGDTTGTGRIINAATLSGVPGILTAVNSAVAFSFASQVGNPSTSTNARCTTVSPAGPAKTTTTCQ